ncbi:MAG: hypothetical protein E4H36_13985 [Spirochaetales bacterium]|nr:MAG: hypothetical protein E4H36_13985 [Spirochaetales bacterium]
MNYKRGQLVEAATLAARSLKEDPANQKSILLLEKVFPEALASLQKKISDETKSDNKFRWSEIADSYGKIHTLNKDVSSLPKLFLKKEKREVSFRVTYFDKEYAEAKQKAAEENYQEGLALSKTKDRGVMRKAVSYFEKALAYVPGYKDAEERMKESGKSATDIVVVLPQELQTKDDLYVKTRDYMQEALVSALIQGAKEKSFLKIIDKSFRDEAIAGQTNVLTGVYDESNFMEIGQLFDANKIVTFSLLSISPAEPVITEKKEKRKTERELYVTDKDYDAYPDHIKRFEGEVTIFKKSAALTLAASYKLVSIENTEIIDSNTLQVTVKDEVTWIDLAGDAEVLNEAETAQYKDFKPEVKTPAQLLEDGKVQLVNQMSGAVLKQFE